MPTTCQAHRASCVNTSSLRCPGVSQAIITTHFQDALESGADSPSVTQAVNGATGHVDSSLWLPLRQPDPSLHSRVHLPCFLWQPDDSAHRCSSLGLQEHPTASSYARAPNPAGSGRWGILTPAPHTHRWPPAQKQAFSPALLSKQRMRASSTHSPVSGGVITLLQPTQ